MRPDTEIKRDVEAELAWDPDIDASDIAIAVRDGVVTMTGFVGSYFQKIEAEAIAKRIKGVLGVANDISIRLPSEHERPDPDIARDVGTCSRANFPSVRTASGWWSESAGCGSRATSNGTSSAGAWSRLRGTSLACAASATSWRFGLAWRQWRSRGGEVLRRQAAFDAGRVVVEASGSEVLLLATVRSWAERQEAERVAWRAPGVTNVDNCLAIAS
jgi:BON domain